MIVAAKPAARDVVDQFGLACSKCGCRDLRVYYTRPRRGGVIVRVRVCRHCGKRIVTREQAEFH